MILLESYINYIIIHKLTQEQFLLLHILYQERKDLLDKYKKAFPNEEGTMISKYQINDLIRREFIIKTKTGFKLGKKFLEIFVDSDLATEEIYELYPPFIERNGVSIPLTTMDRRLFGKIYINKIKGSYDEHEEIKKDIQYAINYGLISTGIEKFLTSEQWKTFRKLREPAQNSKIDIITDDFDNEF